jgi:hypothetical protein
VSTLLFGAGLWAGTGTAGWGTDAATVNLTAALATQAEVPKPTGTRPGARGTFTASLTRQGTRGSLSWRLTFRSLTGAAAAAHIHVARPGVAGPVAVGLCGPCRSGASGTARLKAATMTALLAGGAYVNVHTAKNPAGEIRGQVRKGGKGVPGSTGTTSTGPTTTYTEPPITTY